MKRPLWRRAEAACACLPLLASSLLLSSAALAEDKLEQAYVVKADGDELFVDVGSASGLVEGAVVELWRPLELRHPISGKVLRDRFRIGTLRMIQSRPEISLFAIEGDLSRAPEAGDLIRYAPLQKEKPPPAFKTDQDTVPLPPIAQNTPDVEALQKMWDELAGSSVKRRIVYYEWFVSNYPTSQYADAVRSETEELRRLLAKSGLPAQGEAAKATPAGATTPSLTSFVAPSWAIENQPLRMAVQLKNSTGAVLHIKAADNHAYSTLAMKELGNGYFAASIPAAQMNAGSLSYFIEAVDTEGRAHSVVGHSYQPDSVDVEAPLEPVEDPDLETSVSVLTDYADYNRLRGNDRVWQTEGSVGFRLANTGLRALRSGFGVYRGVGGSVQELDELGNDPRNVGLTYGYLEVETAFIESFSIIGRGIVGLGDDGVAGGGQFFFRIGSDRSTNLQLGGEVLGQVGLRSIAQLELASFERVPIMFRTEVTNQPAGASPSADDNGDGVSRGEAEIGARGIAQVGLRITNGLMVAARGSIQGRTIEHTGPGMGGAVSYTW